MSAAVKSKESAIGNFYLNIQQYFVHSKRIGLLMIWSESRDTFGKICQIYFLPIFIDKSFNIEPNHNVLNSDPGHF